MSISEPNARAPESGPFQGPVTQMSTPSAAARGFLLWLVTRQVQLGERAGSWLRTAGQHVAALGMVELSANLIQWAERNRANQDELIVGVHRMVARWNRTRDRQLDANGLLAEPLSAPMLEFVEFNERTVTGATPWAVLAILGPVEEVLANAVPLSIDIARVDDTDLLEVSRAFEARARFGRELRDRLERVLHEHPGKREHIESTRDRAVEIFSQLLNECTRRGGELARWRHEFIRRATAR